MKSFSKFHSESVAVLRKPAQNVGKKIAGAVLAAKSGDELLKKLLGTPSKPKRNDWDTNPKDDVDSELNVKQGQAKDAAANKEFDREMGALRRGEKNISPEDKLQRLKDAAKKHRKNKKSNVVPMRKPEKK
jgi:hypothetical protein